MKVAELEYRDDELTLTIKVNGDENTAVLGKELMDSINKYYNEKGGTE